MTKMADVVLIGEDPGPRGLAECPLFPHPRGSAGSRLRELSGLGLSQYVACHRVNLFGKTPDRWSESHARAQASNLRASGFLTGKKVVCVGKKVWRAFYGVPHYEYPDCHFYITESNRIIAPMLRIAWIHHPSGRNRWYNDEKNRERVERFLREEVFGS